MNIKHLGKEETGRKRCFTVGGEGWRGGTRYDTHNTRNTRGMIHMVHATLENVALATKTAPYTNQGKGS